MSKLIKAITLGVATAAIVTASTSAFAFCPRGGYYNSGYNSYNGYYKNQYSSDYYGYEKSHKNNYKSYDDTADTDNTAVDETVVEKTKGVAISTKSRIFEITDKSECDEEGCDALTLRDADGSEIEVAGIEFDKGIIDGTSEEELSYHLSQNGSAIRGRLQEVEAKNGDTTYSVVVEKIYS